MTRIATIVTGAKALTEFQLLLYTLEQWEPTAEVFVLTDTPTSLLLAAIKSRLRVRHRVGLDDYTGLTRKDMEARNGSKYVSLWHDFMMEKSTVLQWALEERSGGVWFLDVDICLLAPLPALPTTTAIALSPHYIRKGDEAKYGVYNGGMMWLRDTRFLNAWRRATYGSRFYEQAALEEVAKEAKEAKEANEANETNILYELPPQDNFGWWRHLQSADAPPLIEARFGYNRRLPCAGLTYEGAVLRSVHTHWDEANPFNLWMRGRLEFLTRSHPPAKQLVQHLQRMFWNKKDKKE
jgi:hypothetical protein